MPSLGDALIVVAVAAAPVVELRGAIPLALFHYGFDAVWALALAGIGNLLPVPALLWGLPRLLELARRVPGLQGPLGWWERRTRRRHGASFARWGALALVLFVALPLPGTGAWTGSLAAVLFGVSLRPALGLIALGVTLAGGLVTLGSLGLLGAFSPR